MSYRLEDFPKFSTSDAAARVSYLEGVAPEDLHSLFIEILHNGVHGFCFSLYEEGQKPGDSVSEDQIRRRLEILKPFSKWIRTFSCTEGNEIIPVIAKELGFKTLVGAWLGKDKAKNDGEIAGLLDLVSRGMVDVAAVGNEVLYRKDLTEDELIAYIRDVKEKVTTVPVGYVDAYYEFAKRPAISEACDIILCNCYPYWEGTPFPNAFSHMRHMYHIAKNAGGGKPVMITETGWPSKGEALRAAVPSELNAVKYFINTQLWAQDENVEIFYFSSFDEDWKKSDEGEVGAYWGIWDSKGRLKF